MPTKQFKTFLRAAEKKAFNFKHRKTINFNIDKYDTAVQNGKKQYADLEAAKQHAKNRKWEGIEKLDFYLEEFERIFTNRGGKVIWAADAEEAFEAIEKIVDEKKAKSVVKSKSMATEEIDLNRQLENKKIAVYETDLGEYIVQLAGEKPYHIITPAMHKSAKDIDLLFHKKLHSPLQSTPQELTEIARQRLRDKYLSADIGITGANFLIANQGAIAITENEGNAWLSMAYPKTHIAIVGIEKVLPKLDDLAHFWPLLATYGTGQDLTVYNSVIFGPKQDGETNGPEEMYVILLDNGRTELLADPKKREAMYCIRCGACLNACPIYKNIGGHTYDTPYPGPIGAVITPPMQPDNESVKHLSEASTLCGKCTEVCPMKIDLHNLLLANRKDNVEKEFTDFSERQTWKWWSKAMLDRDWLNNRAYWLKSLLFQLLFENSWGKRRKLPELPKQSFNQQWRERQEQKQNT